MEDDFDALERLLDDDEEEVEEEEVLELKDIRQGKSKSLGRSIKSASSKFTQFLRYQNKNVPALHPYIEYVPEEMNPEYFTPGLIGQFADYMINVDNRAHQTVESYLSRIKTDIYDKLEGNSHIRECFKGKQPWFQSLRNKCKSLCNLKCVETGEKLSESATPMTKEDLELLCQCLFEANTAESYEDRCMLIFAWQLFGRISEIGNLTFSDVTFFSSASLRCLLLHVNRLKTNNQHFAQVFIHQNWMMCPFHALASMLSMGYSGDAKMFPQCDSKHVNKLLKDVDEQIQSTVGDEGVQLVVSGVVSYGLSKGLYSRSLRNGPATEMNLHPGLDVSHIVARGNWTLSKIHTVYRYITPTHKGESMIGRALSGWGDVHHGGIAPSVDAIAADDRDRFRAVACTLFHGHGLTVELCTVLLCVLMLHYEEVERLYPTAVVHSKMMQCMMSPDREKVQQWHLAIKAWHDNRNGMYVPLSRVDEANSVNVATLKDQMDVVCQAVKDISANQSRLAENQVRMEENQKRMQEDISGMIAASAVARNNGITLAPTNGIAVVPRELVKAAQFPDDLMCLKKLTVQGAYYKWYTQELKSVQTDPKSVPRDNLSRIERVVYYLNKFLDEGEEVPQKPEVHYNSPSNAEVEALLQWCEVIRKLGDKTSKRAMAACDNERTSKRRKLEPFVFGMLKRLTQLPVDKFVF